MIISKQVLIIVSATFITLVSWVVFDILHARSQITINPEVQSVIEPLNPTLNTKGLERF